MKLHIDTKSYNEKPQSAEMRIIKPRLQSENTIVDIDIKKLCERIRQGYTVSLSVLIGGCKAENFDSQQVFMVDIDNENVNTEMLTIEKALEICKAKNLPVAFYYYSFNHSKEKDKFRLAFVMDEVVTDTTKRKIIVETLINLFEQSDTSCKNADRVFYGTNKEVILLDEDARITYSDIIVSTTPRIEPVKQSFLAIEDDELERLKKDFDFFGFLKSRNGEIVSDNSSYAMFKHCELCGHQEDLAYYHSTHTFNCFSNSVNKGGTIIDYLMIANRCNAKDAIERFKYVILGLKKKELAPSQKKDFAILTNVKVNKVILGRVVELFETYRYSLDDKGFGALFADTFKDYCRYNVTAREWYIFNGKFWARDTEAMNVRRRAKELSNILLVYATTLDNERWKKDFLEIVSKLAQLKYRETMIKDARDKFFISESDLDKNEDLFNCQNGTLNLKSFEFKPHSDADMLSKISNVNYEPSAKSECWERFINEIMLGNEEKTKYLQKILGYALTTDTRLETCFILYGATTRNGKSTLIETISNMLGGTSGYSMTTQPQTLAQKQTDTRQASGDIARLKGCRFLNASEPPKRMMFDVALVKTLLGRDSITSRHLHEREFEFIPTFKLFINTNFLPLITDDTMFSSGRINIISFDRHFEPYEQDTTLKDRLQEPKSLSGIFNWCLNGLKLFYQEGAEPPPSVKDSTSEYRTNSDKLGNFISECLVKSEFHSKALDIYNCYSKWCEDNGFGCENKSNFLDELRAKNLLKISGTIKGKTEKNVVKGYEIEDLPESFKR